MTIFNPDTGEVTEIVLPDGSQASEVVAPDGSVVWTAGPDIPDSAILFYTHEDSDTSGVTDDSGNGNDGSPVGDPQYSTTAANGTYGYDLDGSGDGLDYPSQASLFDGSNPFTVTMWVYPRTLDSNIYMFWSAKGDFNIDIRWNETQLQANYYDGTVNAAASDGSLTTGQWQFITARWDPAADYTISINTTQKGAVATGAPNSVSASNSWGYDSQGDSLYSDIILDEAAVHDKLLSDAEEQDIYSRGPA